MKNWLQFQFKLNDFQFDITIIRRLMRSMRDLNDAITFDTCDFCNMEIICNLISFKNFNVEMKFRQPLQSNCCFWKAEKRLSACIAHSFSSQHKTSVEYVGRCERLLYYLVVYCSCCSLNVYNWNSMLEVLLFGDYMVRCIFEFVSFILHFTIHRHDVYCIIMRFVFDKNINKVFKHFIYWTSRTKQKDVRENEIRIG